MVKIIIGFVILAVAALFVLKNASHVDLGGEHSAQEAMQKAQDAPTDPNKADPAKGQDATAPNQQGKDPVASQPTKQ
jgi:hypothetical protein